MNPRFFKFYGVLLVILVISLVVFLWFGRAGQTSHVTVQNVSYEVRVTSEPKHLRVGEVATVQVQVLHRGSPIDLYGSGRLLHVVIASADIGDISHTLAPTEVGRGTYAVDHTFTRPGKYRIWTEIDNAAAPQRHDAHAEQIAYLEVTVDGETASLVSETVSEVTKNGYRFRLEASPLVAGEVATLRVQALTPAGQLVPLEPHEPFLYAMSGENFSFFRHGHGATLPDGSAGLENIFPVAGRYVFWVEFILEEAGVYRSIDVPFIITVFE